MKKQIGAEQRLLELGRKALSRGGIRGLGVRQLCEEAGVSPGTFTSFFGTKRVFADRLLALWYDELKSAVGVHCDHQGTAYERLHAELCAVVRFAGQNGGFLLQLLQDIAAGEASARALIPVAEVNHLSWLQQAIRDAQAEGEIVPGEPRDLLLYLIGAVNMPVAISQLMKNSGENDKFRQMLAAPGSIQDSELPAEEDKLRQLFAQSATEKAALQRLEWALTGIRTRKEGGAA